ncbi:MAG: hypothetical protein IKJ54_03720 [Anaerotignum sp.]|nr:hypothetical protein [Anaerotignum sp.]
MENIRGWIGSVAAVMMIMAAVSAICPKNSAGRIVALCGSLILTAVLITPLKSFDVALFEQYAESYVRGLEEKGARLKEENEMLRDDIIEKNLRAYILERADMMGIDCDVRVESRNGVPHSAEICVKDKAKAYAVKEMIKKEALCIKSAKHQNQKLVK